MPWRTGKQIRDRYLNSLDKRVIKRKFNNNEDEQIIKLYKKYGNSWSTIAKFLQGRTGDMVKNRFYSKLFKLIKNKNSFSSKSNFHNDEDFIEKINFCFNDKYDNFLIDRDDDNIENFNYFVNDINDENKNYYFEVQNNDFNISLNETDIIINNDDNNQNYNNSNNSNNNMNLNGNDDNYSNIETSNYQNKDYFQAIHMV